MFSFFDDEGRVRYPLMISRTNYESVANLLYWKQHYAQITSIYRLFSDIRKHNHQKHFWLRCLGHFNRRKSSLNTWSSVPETTSCLCCMYYRSQAPSRRKSNSTSTIFVLRHFSSFMQILSPSSSRPIARLYKLPKPRRTKCVQQRLFLPQGFITLTNGT